MKAYRTLAVNLKTMRNRTSKIGCSVLLMAGVIALIVLLCAVPSNAQTVSPFQGLGNVQFFDNNGQLLTGGVLYSYQAGTTTQQATYTDATGTALNPNPITFSSGARANIWLTAGNFYKFVLCAQNDGASCSPADVLFSVDQVPGGGSGTGGGTTGIFISSTVGAATSGILRLAAGDSICWRNTAGTANQCINKDSSDVLSWSNGSIKFPQVAAPGCAIGFDYLWADNTALRWLMCNNGGVQQQIVGAGVDINNSDQVIQLHFGAGAIPLCGSTPAVGQTLIYNGSCLGSGGTTVTVAFSTPSTPQIGAITSTSIVTVGASSATYRLAIPISTTVAGTGCSGNTVITASASWTDPNNQAISLNMTTLTVVGTAQSAIGSPPIMFRAKNGTNITYAVSYAAGGGCSPGPTFQVFPVVEQMTLN